MTQFFEHFPNFWVASCSHYQIIATKRLVIGFHFPTVFGTENGLHTLSGENVYFIFFSRI